jgi:lysozyme family protein
MASFDEALRYVLENEGVDFNHPADSGGRTRFGITAAVARKHSYDVERLTLEQAAQIYRKDYWLFGSIPETRVAAKLLDTVVNFGAIGGTKLIQRALGVPDDGKFGPKTEAAILRTPSEEVIERVSQAAADHYVNICRANPSQLAFLRGWMRRAIRRPKLKMPAA